MKLMLDLLYAGDPWAAFYSMPWAIREKYFGKYRTFRYTPVMSQVTTMLLLIAVAEGEIL